MINVVLVNPEIPNNTGNIVRTCAATGAVLHVIEPCGFSWEDKYLKRSGLDYWEISDVRRYPDMHAFLAANFGDKAADTGDVPTDLKVTKTNTGTQFLYASTKSKRTHCEVSYRLRAHTYARKRALAQPRQQRGDHRLRISPAARLRRLERRRQIDAIRRLKKRGEPPRFFASVNSS